MFNNNSPLSIMLARFGGRAFVAKTQQTQRALVAATWLPARYCSDSAKKEAEKDAEKETKEEVKEQAKEEASPELAKLQAEAESLKKELKDKEAEVKDLKAKVLYSVAEADNARRIGREDAAKAREFSITSFGKDMLEVVDVLDRAVDEFKKLPEGELENHASVKQIFTGVKLTESVLVHNLGRSGVERMSCEKGEKFDPNRHEALFNAPATEEAPEGTIAHVIKSGYMIKERVLRAAQVGVAEGKP